MSSTPTIIPKLSHHAVIRFRDRVRPKGLFTSQKRAQEKLQELLEKATPAGMRGERCLRTRFGNQDIFFLLNPEGEVVTTVLLHPIKPSKEKYVASKQPTPPKRPGRGPHSASR